MKIAVFFGSFNPMTNGHIAVMKTAVEKLGADKGLFVATNGQYLRRKTVKLGDPFYLTEEDRRKIIEQVCAGEERLAFWGYELGGFTPSRYRTLCKIQKEYPDARLYEIMGADKVHTLTTPSYAQDYLSRFRFAVFSRDGIDLQQMMDDSPLLTQHRDSFVLLPPPDVGAQISSTEVRNRFYAGEAYEDLIPRAAAEVLSQYRPEDFTISFPERMEALMRSGRFGRQAAAKEVYKENLTVFARWQKGASDIPFTDYQAFLDGTRLYTDAYSVAGQGTFYDETQTGCVNMDCVELAQDLLKKGYDPAILNLASAKSPGGGYHQGYNAQEESLCQRSNLSLSLYQFGDPKYKHIRQCGAPIKPGYPLDRNFGGIYTPNVTFFRHGRSRFFALQEEVFRCDVITVAALSFNGRADFCGVNELDYRSEAGGFTPEGEGIMLDKIRTIFRMGVEHGKDASILGAFGCGAYKLPVPEVARLFRRVMDEPEFAHKFRLITFAILESSRKPNGLNGKFAAFYREFGSYPLT